MLDLLEPMWLAIAKWGVKIYRYLIVITLVQKIYSAIDLILVLLATKTEALKFTLEQNIRRYPLIMSVK